MNGGKLIWLHRQQPQAIKIHIDQRAQAIRTIEKGPFRPQNGKPFMMGGNLGL